MFPINGASNQRSFGNGSTGSSPTPPPPCTSFGFGDGSWELRVYVTDLDTEKVLRVKSDLHIGGVMLKLVEELGEFGIRYTCICGRYCAN